MKNEGPPNLTPFSWGCAAALCVFVQIGAGGKKGVRGVKRKGRVQRVCICQGMQKTKWADNRSEMYVPPQLESEIFGRPLTAAYGCR